MSAIKSFQLFSVLRPVFVAAGPYTPVAGVSSGWNGWTLVDVIPAALLSNVVGKSQMRITFAGGNSGVEAGHCSMAYIGAQASSGDAYDFATTPVQVLVAGAGAFTIPFNSTIVSDWANFSLPASTALLIAMSFDTALNDNIGTSATVSTLAAFQRNISGDAATVNKSTYTSASPANSILGVVQVDVR